MTHEIDIYEIAGHTITFAQWVTRTNYAVTEHAELHIDGGLIAKGTDKWLNRPWYQFRYQNARYCAAIGLVKDCERKALEKWKAERGYKVMTAKRREELQANTNGRLINYATCDEPYALALGTLCAARVSRRYDSLGARELDILARLAYVATCPGHDGRQAWKFVSKPGESGEQLFFKWDTYKNTIYC